MDPKQRLLVAISALALSSGTLGLSTQPARAQTPPISDVTAGLCTTEEECCLLALETNTIEAIEDFLARFPPGDDGELSACYALALERLEDYTPSSILDRPPPPGPSPY